MQQKEIFLENILKILEKCSLFENFTPEEIESLINCLNYKIHNYNKNDIVLLSGDEITFIGIVLKGELEITRDDAFGNSIILSKISEGDIFAEAIVCSNIGKSPITVTSITNSTIIYLSYNKIINICSNVCTFHTQLISNMLKIIANKNILLNDKIEILLSKSIREKLNIFFSKQVEKNKSTKFKIPYSRLELANFLNVNRSALSRELSNMQNEGLLKFNKNNFEIFIK